MKSLVEFIIESTTIQSIQSTTMDEFCDNISPNDIKTIGSFIKGKNHQSALNIYFASEHKYLHIHRYEDMHNVTLSFVYDYSQEWPDEEAWDMCVEYKGLNDRSSMKDLVQKFIDYIKTHHREFN